MFFFDTKNKDTIKLKKYVTEKEFKDSEIPDLKDVDGKKIKSIDIFNLIS